MRNHQKENSEWAAENGYEFHAVTQGAFYQGARSLDVFRKAESFRDHVVGTSRGRPFEILDFQRSESEGGEWGFVWKTVILISTAGLDLPNFDLLPRRETAGMNFLGIKGLDLKVNPLAPPDEQRLVDAFNKNYSLFAGGAFEAMEASIRSADHLVPSLSDMALVCKPSVLRFLSTAVTGTVELQNGFLAVRAPETRIIRGAFSDTILQGRERESLLAVANDLLDVLSNAANEAPLRALTLENTFRPAQLLGGIIGGVVGFCLGGFIGIVLLFLLKEKQLFLIPVLALGGAALGHFIGKMLTRAR
jgi:hypothetical protein